MGPRAAERHHRLDLGGDGGPHGRGGAWLITRRLSATVTLLRWQNLLEALVSGMREQIREICQQAADPA